VDPVTHAIFGALSANLLPFARKHRSLWALASIAAVSPDLDLMIPYRIIPFEAESAIHRLYTHTLICVPFMALFLAWAFKYLLRKETLCRSSRYLLALTGLCSHLFLDFFTIASIPLLWPWTSSFFSLGLCNNLDPLFSGLIFFTLLCLLKDKSRFAFLGGLLSLCYGILAEVQYERADYFQQQLCLQRHHNPARRCVFPSPFNILLWRSLYEREGYYYVDGFCIGSSLTSYRGGKFLKARLEDISSYKGTHFYEMVAYFFRKSMDYVGVTEGRNYVDLHHCLFLPYKNSPRHVLCLGKTPSGDPMVIPQKEKSHLKDLIPKDGVDLLKLLLGDTPDEEASVKDQKRAP
jgi:inner membrane protein